ncbi:MAG: hypothetical protein RMJ87_12345 [Cytophagales bacterium]|nr:hypothetical protein [Bernardetiaceae bacterium]MDW8205812.1 hypothetical protein [Cytophagales bacterium]
MKAYRAKKYADAVLLFENILAEKRQDEQALYYAALCYLHLQQATTAYDYLKMIPKSQATFLDEYYYWLSRAAYMQHLFEESKTILNSYLNERGSRKFIKEATTLLTHINYALELQQKPVLFNIENIRNINSLANESVPVGYAGTQRFWFIRKKRNQPSESKTAPEKEGWFIAQQQTNGQWTRQLEDNINKNNFAVLQWIEHERSVLVLKGGKLYMVKPSPTGWQVLRELDVPFRETSRPLAATLYDQSRKLIFSAFNPETSSLDLFYTELKTDGVWSVPYPIVEINSTRDEYTPFFANDTQTLYFSSKGWNSIGGFDIFTTRYDPAKKRWTMPENIGFPINSAGDDYWMQIYGQKGLLASNRSGSVGGEDIYLFFPLTKILLTGKITGRRGEPLSNTTIQFLYQNKSIQVRTDAFGYYKIELPVETDIQARIWLQGKIQYQENFRISNPETGSNTQTLQRHFNLQTSQATDAKPTSEQQETTAFVFTINGNVKDAIQKQPLRATVKLIDVSSAKTVKFTSTDANGKFNFYLEKPVEAYFIEVIARGFLSYWQTGEQLGKEEHTITLQPIASETNWHIPAISFDAQSDKFKHSAIPVLDKLSMFLLENGTLKVQVRCPEGTAQMGEKRAASIASYLIQKGVSPTRISTGTISNSSLIDTGIELYILP